MPLWEDLLLRLAKALKKHPSHPDLIQYAEDCIGKGQLPRAASAISRAGIPQDVMSELKAFFSRKHFNNADPASKREMQLRLETLTSLPWAGYITTNYDTLITDYFSNVGRPFDNICNGPADNLGRAMKSSERPFFIHLHGAVGSGNLILTEEDYDDAYLGSSSMNNFLAAILLRYTLVFIGTQVEDRFVELRRHLQLLFQRKAKGLTADLIPPEYVLLAHPQEALRGSYLEYTGGFKAIYYTNSTQHHEGLVSRLKEMKKGVSEHKYNAGNNDAVRKRLEQIVKAHPHGVMFETVVEEFWSKTAAAVRGRDKLNNHELYYCLFYLAHNNAIDIGVDNGEEVFRPLSKVTGTR
jgi:SIR2-like domain